MIILVGIILIIYGIDLVGVLTEGQILGGVAFFNSQGIEFRENYMPKKYAVTIRTARWLFDN